MAAAAEANLLRRGANWLDQQRASHLTSPVIYRRDGVADLPVSATTGSTRYEVGDAYGGTTVQAQVTDFLILALDLAVAGIEPQPGDVIVADGIRNEVMAMGEDASGWRWSGPAKTTYRIHTKQIGTET